MENNIGKEFMRLTKYEFLEPSAQSQGVEIPLMETPVETGAEVLPLPDGRSLDLDPIDFIELVEKRETLRKYSTTELTLTELAYLLWGTQGVKSVTDKPISKRTVPSAGSRHPFETYLLVNRVEGLKPGLYRYLAVNHQIAHLQADENIAQQLAEACLKQQHVLNSAVTFIWVAVVERTVWRYCQRAYRYMHLDAGHICQNLYLLAEAINCGVCALAAFDDNLVNAALKLDGEKQFAMYLATLGKRE